MSWQHAMVLHPVALPQHLVGEFEVVHVGVSQLTGEAIPPGEKLLTHLAVDVLEIRIVGHVVHAPTPWPRVARLVHAIDHKAILGQGPHLLGGPRLRCLDAEVVGQMTRIIVYDGHRLDDPHVQQPPAKLRQHPGDLCRALWTRQHTKVCHATAGMDGHEDPAGLVSDPHDAHRPWFVLVRVAVLGAVLMCVCFLRLGPPCRLLRLSSFSRRGNHWGSHGNLSGAHVVLHWVHIHGSAVC
mmetsp:Transcript_36054/g.89928  ORF Transcript_36054/g.89928 Transcript_36054/m.89928 type:complete len:240 (-) Transcript_36054:739-1458(-)